MCYNNGKIIILIFKQIKDILNALNAKQSLTKKQNSPVILSIVGQIFVNDKLISVIYVEIFLIKKIITFIIKMMIRGEMNAKQCKNYLSFNRNAKTNYLVHFVKL